jgi:hypothetical protein
MMACLLAEIRINRERKEVKAIREKMDANQEKIETNKKGV